MEADEKLELISMIEKKEYMSRRQELMSMMHKNSIAVISSAPEKVRSRDTNYPYKQNVNLTYLAGFPEPESVLVLIPDLSLIHI